MKKFFPVLQNTKLFNGINKDQISALLMCLNAQSRDYNKGSVILQQGDEVHDIMLLVKGRLYIQNNDYWGNSNIMNTIETGEMFGESYVSPQNITMLNNVIAIENSTVLFLDAMRIIKTCSSNCTFHTMLVRNLFYSIAGKNRKLVQKLGHMSNRSTREKLMSYLSAEAAKQNSSTFTIPFNRQQLADFLSVERSAMSNELSKMRKDGLIEFEKSTFKLIQ